MKNILYLIIITSIFFSCAPEESSGPEGFKTQSLETTDLVFYEKSFSIGPTCGSNKNCNAIIYSGRIGTTNQVGIAIDNSHTFTSPVDQRPPTFKILIYWNGSLSGSNQSFDLSPKQYSIKIWDGTYYESISTAQTQGTTDNLDISLTVSTESTVIGSKTFNQTIYSITFNSGINVSGYTISGGDTIVAAKY
jgi:hypothetical protein